MNHKTVVMVMIWRFLVVDKSLKRDTRAGSWKDRRWYPECGMLGNNILEVVLILKNEIKSYTSFTSGTAKSFKINIIN